MQNVFLKCKIYEKPLKINGIMEHETVLMTLMADLPFEKSTVVKLLKITFNNDLSLESHVFVTDQAAG